METVSTPSPLPLQLALKLLAHVQENIDELANTKLEVRQGKQRVMDGISSSVKWAVFTNSHVGLGGQAGAASFKLT